jgi:hypothetical protein
MATKKGMTIIDLQREKANRKEFTGRVRKTKPELVVLNGHGNPRCVTGHDNEPLVDDKNSTILKETITYARSCSSAQILGQLCVKNGAKAYIGYVQPFIVFFDDTKLQHPLEDEVVANFLEPSNQVVISLLKGHTASEASERSKELSKKKMLKLMSSDAPPEAGVYLQFVRYNMLNQQCIGDPNATL